MKQQEVPAEDLSLVESLRTTINHLNADISKLRCMIGSKEQLNHELIELIPKLDPYLPTYKPRRGGLKVSSNIVTVIQFGDWHIGEVTDATMTRGYGEYNYAIAQKRIFDMVDAMMRWVELHRSNYRINECFILDLGDNISGDIHDELRVTNEFPVPVQIIKAAYLKSEVYRRIATHFKKVHVEFVVPDNHSRKTKKPQSKQSGENSENLLVGHITKVQLSKIFNIDFNLHLGYQALVDVNGRRYLCEHGNRIRGWAGIPWYGVDRKIAREAKRTMHDHGFDKLLIQHFHTAMFMQHAIVGGSLSGSSELDHQEGRHDGPCQCAWMAHPKHGEFDWTPFRG